MTLQASPSHLSRRERQIMDIVYKLGRATVGEVMERLSGNPAYSTVRAQLRVLEEKGHLVHEEHGLRYVYLPKVPREVVRKSALKHLIDTFFEGSAGEAVAALLGKEGFKVSEEELARISELIQHAKKEGRKK
jgi:BlaI family transcriptional regulator, penicillinase repressor